MKLKMQLESRDKLSFDLALKTITDLSNKKGVCFKKSNLPTVRIPQPRTGYILMIHRAIIEINNPTESFMKTLRNLTLFAHLKKAGKLKAKIEVS